MNAIAQWVQQPHAIENEGIRLEPLADWHEEGLKQACQDGQLWRIRVTGVPEPDQVAQYIATAQQMQQQGTRTAFAVIDAQSHKILGSTSYHDIVPEMNRLEIGYTWYAQSVQRTHVNTTCKLLLLQHAFETLNAEAVGWRTDNFNHASQRAIERLGAKKDGVIRHHTRRRDGTVRDTVMYSMLAGEWAEAKAQLLYRLQFHGVC